MSGPDFEFKSEPSQSPTNTDGLCLPVWLEAKASFTDISIHLIVEGDIDDTYSGFHDTRQIRQFATWLNLVANQYDARER